MLLRKLRRSRRRTDLDEITAPDAPISDKSIAVLPFADIDEEEESEYFADGMAEEILGYLRKDPGLTVIGRTSSFQFKEQERRPANNRRTTSAAFVVEGSVRRAGPRISGDAQFIHARSGAHRWSRVSIETLAISSRYRMK